MVTAGLAESNGSLPRVYGSRHLQADCKNRDQLRNPTLGNRVWATFFNCAPNNATIRFGKLGSKEMMQKRESTDL